MFFSTHQSEFSGEHKMNSCDRTKMKHNFDEIINSRDVKVNSALLTREKYQSLMQELKQVHDNPKRKTSRQYWLMKRFDIVQVQGVEKLIFPDPNSTKYYVCSEELFDTLYETHISFYHAGRDRMLLELRKKYKNITQTDIITFLNCCEYCLRKKKADNVPVADPKSQTQSEKINFNSRGIVDFIDYRAIPDDGYQFVLIYSDDATKFTILRPLKALIDDEIAANLLDVFLTFGAPCVLQSTVSREFTWSIVQSLRKMWPELRMVHGKNAEKLYQIESLISAAMLANGNEKWKDFLRFAQFERNKTYNFKLKCTPQEATFGRCAQVGFSTCSLSQYVMDNIESEEELRNVMYGERIEVKVEKTDDEGVTCDLNCSSCGKVMSGDECEFCKVEEPNVKKIKIEAETDDEDLCLKTELKTEYCEQNH